MRPKYSNTGPPPRHAFLASVAGASCTPWTSSRYALASRRRTRGGQSSRFRLRLLEVRRASSICGGPLEAPRPDASATLLVSVIPLSLCKARQSREMQGIFGAAALLGKLLQTIFAVVEPHGYDAFRGAR